MKKQVFLWMFCHGHIESSYEALTKKGENYNPKTADVTLTSN